jgi:hypothetical protein
LIVAGAGVVADELLAAAVDGVAEPVAAPALGSAALTGRT